MLVDALPPATDIVARLLAVTPADEQEAMLCQVRTRTEAGLASWEAQHLRYIEQGWEALWLREQELKQALLTELNRVLAERFGR